MEICLALKKIDNLFIPYFATSFTGHVARFVRMTHVYWRGEKHGIIPQRSVAGKERLKGINAAVTRVIPPLSPLPMK